MTHEIESFRRFIFSTVDQLVDSLEGLDPPMLNWRPPAAAANSLYAIAAHVLGNAEENILEVLCGEPGRRDRAAEFSAQGVSTAPIRARWVDLQARIRAGLARLGPDALDRERTHPRRGTLTGRDVLLVVARHAAEHWGEAQLTRGLVLAARPESASASDPDPVGRVR